MKSILTFAGGLGIALAASFATASEAADCKGAKSPVENALCSSPRAHELDAEVSAALAVLMELSTPEAEAAWTDDQSAWLSDRDLRCSYDGEANTPAKRSDISECVVDQSTERIRFLEAVPEEGPGQSSRIGPVILKGTTGSNFSLRFANPKTAGEKLMNQALDAQAAKLHLTDPDYSDYLRVKLRYASPTLLSAEVLGRADRNSDPANASDNDGYFDYNLNIDMRAGRVLSLADAFVPGALPRLQRDCFSQLKDYFALTSQGETAAERAADLARAKTIVADLSQWSFGAKQATITMDPGDEEPYACHFGYAYLRKISRPGFPLPTWRTM